MSISITILGALFKIQHWAIANTLLTFGLSSVAVIYIFRFLNKKTKSIFDWLKLVSVCSLFILKALIMTHTIEEVYGFINVIIWIITYLYFVFTKTTNIKIINKNANQLRNGQCRVRVIDMNRKLILKVIQCTVLSVVFFNEILHRC